MKSAVPKGTENKQPPAPGLKSGAMISDGPLGLNPDMNSGIPLGLNPDMNCNIPLGLNPATISDAPLGLKGHFILMSLEKYYICLFLLP